MRFSRRFFLVCVSASVFLTLFVFVSFLLFLFIPPPDSNARFHVSCSADSHSSQPVEKPTEETSVALNQVSGLVKGNHMCSLQASTDTHTHTLSAWHSPDHREEELWFWAGVAEERCHRVSSGVLPRGEHLKYLEGNVTESSNQSFCVEVNAN